jgi:hypothetical protein
MKLVLRELFDLIRQLLESYPKTTERKENSRKQADCLYTRILNYTSKLFGCDFQLLASACIKRNRFQIQITPSMRNIQYSTHLQSTELDRTCIIIIHRDFYLSQ